MLIDARRLRDSELRTDVCIVGVGPAGIALARELHRAGVDVVLLESGGLTEDPRAQLLSEGDGDDEVGLRASRRRQFGGNANRWAVQYGQDVIGVRYAPFDDIDFERHDWLPHSGWPIDRRVLDPYYERAHELCRLGPFDYRATPWASDARPTLPLEAQGFETTIFRFGPRSVFTTEAAAFLGHAPGVTVLLHATGVAIELQDGAGIARGVSARTSNGHHVTVEAREVVLACGGIENARQLLLTAPDRGGLGNAHDQVGRYFMDHPLAFRTRWWPSDRSIFARTSLYDMRQVDAYGVMGKLLVAPDVRRREQLLGMSFMLYPRDRRAVSPGIESTRAAVSALRGRTLPPRPLHQAGTILREGVDLVTLGVDHLRGRHDYCNFSKGGWSSRAAPEDRFDVFELYSQIEVAPDPGNRVVLGDSTDVNGQRRARLVTALTELDRNSIARTKQLFADAIGATGLGRVEIEPVPCDSDGSYHHMGATRMSVDPRHGVVDAHCLVHGTRNVSVAGSSVFATGSYANPTLTIVALAIRLADRLASRLRAPTVIRLSGVGVRESA